MTDRLYHVLDTALATLLTGVTAACTAVIATIPTVNTQDWQQQLLVLLLSFIGSLVTFCGAVMLNPQQEHRKIVIGRAAFALFFGAVAPSIAMEITPNLLPEGWMWMMKVLSHPASVLAAGGIVAMAVYVISRPFCFRLYDRADAMAAAQVKRIEEFAKGPHNTVIVLDPAKMPAEPPKPQP